MCIRTDEKRNPRLQRLTGSQRVEDILRECRSRVSWCSNRNLLEGFVVVNWGLSKSQHIKRCLACKMGISKGHREVHIVYERGSFGIYRA
jgi:hypothetical protein